jgi:hypothetical protein
MGGVSTARADSAEMEGGTGAGCHAVRGADQEAQKGEQSHEDADGGYQGTGIIPQTQIWIG